MSCQFQVTETALEQASAQQEVKGLRVMKEPGRVEGSGPETRDSDHPNLPSVYSACLFGTPSAVSAHRFSSGGGQCGHREGSNNNRHRVLLRLQGEQTSESHLMRLASVTPLPTTNH